MSVAEAFSLYRRFHQKDPDRVTGLPGVALPGTLGDVGRMVMLVYRSAKWSPSGRTRAYAHEYESGVRFCEPWRPGLRRVEMGAWPDEIVELGECLAALVDARGELYAPRIRRGTRLIATPDGRRLALLDPSGEIVGVILGGKQRVTERGIEG